MKLRMPPFLLLMLAATPALGQESVVVHAGCTWTLPTKLEYREISDSEDSIYSNLNTRGVCFTKTTKTVRFSRKQELFDQGRFFRKRYRKNSESHSDEFFLAKWHAVRLYDPNALVPDTTILQNKKTLEFVHLMNIDYRSIVSGCNVDVLERELEPWGEQELENKKIKIIIEEEA